MTIQFEHAVTVRCAFAERRQHLLKNWFDSRELGWPTNMEFWAKRMEETNDAEAALRLLGVGF